VSSFQIREIKAARVLVALNLKDMQWIECHWDMKVFSVIEDEEVM
jgi:hypothetical protein